MISKLRFSLIAVVMLVLLGFGFQDQARGQVGAGGLFCPAVPNTTGYLEAEIVGSGAVAPNFTGALIGTVESLGIGVNFGDNVAGLDWQHVDLTSFYSPTPTNEVGSQLVSWWTQKNGRNTYLQVTNNDPFGKINVHVRIHNEDCAEIRDFCDTFTPNDTHEYNLGDLFANNGADISEANLQGVEGWLVVTAVDECGLDSEVAYNFNHLSGQLIVSDSDDYVYGVNTYARRAVCFTDMFDVDVNRIANPSFADDLAFWNDELPFVFVTTGQGIDPAVATPSNPSDSENMAFLISDEDGSGSFYDNVSFVNDLFLEVKNVTETSKDDANVALLESAPFIIESGDDLSVSYNMQMYTGNDESCDAYVAAALIEVTGVNTGNVVDANCYVQSGSSGQIDSDNKENKPCIELRDSDDDIAFGNFEFNGRSGFQIGETLSRLDRTGTFVVQVFTAQKTDCVGDGDEFGALFNNFQINGVDVVELECDGTLNGDLNARLDNVLPETLYAQFNILPDNDFAGADVVHINFADQYGPPYRVIKATSNVEIGIYDEDENFQSCGDATGVCFVRLGIDDPIVLSEDFDPFIPTLPPTSTPPTSTPPTDTPTTRPPSGGSSSCAIAGSPVQLGTALANVLIPLVPVAFAFGVRAVRRRKK